MGASGDLDKAVQEARSFKDSVKSRGSDEAMCLAFKTLVDACHAKGDAEEAIQAATEASRSSGNVEAIGLELLADSQLENDLSGAVESGKKLRALGTSKANKEWEAKGCLLVADAHLRSYEIASQFL